MKKLLFALLLIPLLFLKSVDAAETCPQDGGWTKIDSDNLSSYPIDGATEYCFKAGPYLTDAIPDGGFGQEGACQEENIEQCGLSHWSYYVPQCLDCDSEPTPTPTPTLTPTPEPTPTVTPHPQPTPPVNTPETNGSSICVSPNVSKLVVNFHVYRNGDSAELRWWPSEGDRVHIYYKNPQSPFWEHSVRDVTNNGNFTIRSLGSHDWSFGVQQAYECSAGPTAVVIDGNRPQLFRFSYWQN